MVHVLRIETTDKKVAERIAEFATELGATVKMSKTAKAKSIERNDTEWIMSSEPRQTHTLAASERSKNPENLTEVNIQDLKRLFGIK